MKQYQQTYFVNGTSDVRTITMYGASPDTGMTSLTNVAKVVPLMMEAATMSATLQYTKMAVGQTVGLNRQTNK